MKLVYSPRRVAAALTLLATGLTAVSVLVHVLAYKLGYSNRVTTLFDMDKESTVSTWYSSAALLFCALLLALIASAKRGTRGGYAGAWTAMAAILLVFSVSEIAMLHERVGLILGSRVKTSGIFYHAWVIPASLFVLVTAAAFLRFLAHLPAPTRNRFLLAGALYFGGALGMEFISARHHEARGMENLTYALLTDVEEFGEMMGVVVLVNALLRYVESFVGDVHIASAAAAGRADREATAC
jgi:hypothetical protein